MAYHASGGSLSDEAVCSTEEADRWRIFYFPRHIHKDVCAYCKSCYTQHKQVSSCQPSCLSFLGDRIPTASVHHSKHVVHFGSACLLGCTSICLFPPEPGAARFFNDTEAVLDSEFGQLSPHSFEFILNLSVSLGRLRRHHGLRP